MRQKQYPTDIRVYINESNIPEVCELNDKWGDKTLGTTVNKIIETFLNTYLEDKEYEQENGTTTER